ncbi:hypothetical protein [Achromobacter sp. K91]|uniref:hypothetical protein n=1 Tax=Achromobacter sp. K91 TaxID=2292262 RepID=UPI0011C35A17|nr:hypothetical protein [Achromobacter sp. K91]
MSSKVLDNLDAADSTIVFNAIERQLRNRLRLAHRIALEETGSEAPQVVTAVFEQLCFRYDDANPPLTH